MASTLVPAQTTEPLSTEQVLATLAQFQAEHADEYQITRLGIFGSVARGTMHADSDIDVVVEIEKADLLILSGIKIDLEEIFNCPVDIVRFRKEMNPFLKNRIEREALYV